VSGSGQTRSFGDVGSMSGLPESGHGWATTAFLVAAATSLVDHTDDTLAQAQPCRSREYAHDATSSAIIVLGKHTVRLYWKRSDGTPYAYL
jgi:hypothetical protein